MTGAPGPGTANELGGTLGGHAVQARSIHGDVNIGAPPGPGTPRPRQLPLPPAHFTDRAGPVAAITGAAAHGGPGCAIIVVSGPGGAGKTAVAVHALHQVAGRYAGQLHAPLGAFGASGPARPQAVLAGWLRALGTHPSAVPGDPGEATALFRSLTAGAPVAVLADAAASEAQVRALLPAAGLVVVTSRYRLPGLAVLAGYCGHLPLAVRAAAARLAARPTLAATAVVAELAAARSRLTALDTTALEISVTASLDASYLALDAGTARAYRLLATCPGTDVTVPAAAALLDADEPAAEQLAVALAAASLIEETAPGRWRYHDLVREHAASLAAQHDTSAERNAATARVIDYYLRGSAAADLLVLPGRLRIASAFGLPIRNPPAFATTAAALAWCDAEQAGLLEAQKTAAALGLHAAAWQFGDTLYGWNSHRHDYPAWQATCEQAISSARACGDARAEVFCAIRLASCHVARGDLAAATPVAEQAVRTAWANGDRAGEGSAREHAGICAMASGHNEDAIAHFTRALDCWRRITSHRRAEAINHRHLGRALSNLCRASEADEHLHTALAIFTELGENYHQARTLYVIAMTRLASGQPEQAVEALSRLERARPLMEAEDHPLSLSELLTALAVAYGRTGDEEQARACVDRAAELQQQLNLPDSHPARAQTSFAASQLR
jgi:tetratricopeptide (TPR) repeat protein